MSIINADFLKIDLETILIDECRQKYGEFENIRIVANLPYYITTPIIMNALESHTHIDSITVMIQRKWQNAAALGSKDYGVIVTGGAILSVPYVARFRQIVYSGGLRSAQVL